MNPVLEIHQLSVELNGPSPRKRIVDDISFVIQPQSIVGLVGGSGSGKTTTALAAFGLLPGALETVGGKVMFDGVDVLKASSRQLREMRGAKVGFVFQEPLEAFNPVFTIGFQIEEVLATHTRINAAARKTRVLEVLSSVGLSDPKRAASSYPHELSGGMRQRAMIAQAMALSPRLIIADEPTSNLDVTLQAKIMELFGRLREREGLSVLLITHDLPLVGHIADEVVVLKQGRLVESGTVADVMRQPSHAYTRELMDAMGV